MANFKLSAAAEADIVALLAWTESRFGDLARRRYEILLASALRDIAADPDRPGSLPRPELGADVRSYHLLYSRERARHHGGIVRRPRHFLTASLYQRSLVVTVGIALRSSATQAHLA